MTDVKKRCAVYARVSTEDQTTENQLRELRQYAASRGWVVAREYIDNGVSGAKRSRPALDELMRDVRGGEYDAVLVWRLDRFSRSVMHLAQTLEEFRALEIQFVSATEAIDTGTAQGRLLFTILSALAEFEREVIRERVKSGMSRAKAQGKHLGRPAKTRARQELFRKIRELGAQGKTHDEICHITGANITVISRALGRARTPRQARVERMSH